MEVRFAIDRLVWHSFALLIYMAVRKLRTKTAAKLLPSKAKKTISLPLKKVVPKNKAAEPIHVDLKPSSDLSWTLQQLKRQFPDSHKTQMPVDLKPMLASVVAEPFNDADWQFEIKWDGYRALSYINKGEVELRSRNNLSFNTKFSTVVKALAQWPVNAVIDGEIVVVSEDGKADFGALQNWPEKQDGTLLYYVFDLLWLDGINLRDEPLWKRQEILRKIMPGSGDPIRFSDSIEEYGIDFFKAAKENGLEGIVAKQKNAAYQTGQRSRDWYKIKVEHWEEVIICGYTRKKKTDRLFSSLVLGIPKNGTILYTGQVGTGFTRALQTEILEKLKPFWVQKCPFERRPPLTDPVQWVQPQVVCEVKYTERTKEGLLRHPSFKGLREDKAVEDINPTIEKKINPEVTEKYTVASVTKKLISSGTTSKIIHLDGIKQTLTNLTKVYWPKEGITKGDLLNYYYSMMPFILPYLLDRPQSLNRYPGGITGQSFYQKNMKGKVLKGMTTFERTGSSEEGKDFLVCTSAADLLYMANLGCIELNPWHSRTISPS